MRLGVNIDHVATLRNARTDKVLDLINVVKVLKKKSVDSVTVHLREDRRHIKDKDVKILKKYDILPINLEMAATFEMQKICIDTMPFACCIVPERREELTTEGGLNVKNQTKHLEKIIYPIIDKKIRLSLFVDPNKNQIDAVKELGVKVVEIHTGSYAQSFINNDYKNELKKIVDTVEYASNKGIECHAGHGLDLKNVGQIAKIEKIMELNVGYSIICESIFLGLEKSIEKFKSEIS